MQTHILHYFRLDSKWYYWIDESVPEKKIWRPYDTDKLTLLSEDILTKKEATNLLRNAHPDCVLNYMILYHSGPRSKHEAGSRPRKGITKHDYFKNSQKEMY